LKLATRDDLCSGCRACEVLCAMVNYGEANPKKSAIRAVGHFPSPGTYSVVICDQCGACAAACPEGAIQAQGEAFVVDPDKCTGCYVCVSACPSGAMFTHPGETVPVKCVLCGECVVYCPRKAVYDSEAREESR
jgi:Fe-S-cluster-containing hydrogenase component 2